MEQFIITCNAGSSDIKVAKYNAATLECVIKLRMHTVEELIAWYKEQENVIAVGHRIVHGGSRFAQPIIISDSVIDQLQQLEPLAPLHQYLALSIISAIKMLTPLVKQIGCFDTAFHKDLPELEKLFPIPYSYYEDGVYRYGFHGLSYEYIASVLPSVAGAAAIGRVVVAHLGNGSSVCGMVNLKSKATSMGFSALDGLMMGSRSGAIDPGLVLYLLKQKGFSIERLEEFLYHESGLKGVSNISNDVKRLESDNSAEAKRALSLYCYTAAKHIGAIVTVIGGVDCIVFTGGIGENSAYVRSEICSYLGYLGVAINNQNNSTASVYVIATDEEKIIVEACLAGG